MKKKTDLDIMDLDTMSDESVPTNGYSTGDDYPPEEYQDNSYRDDNYQNDSYQTDGYEQNTYGDSSYPDESYQNSSYQNNGYQESSYQDAPYQQGSYQTGPYEENGYPDDTNPQPGYQEGSYDSSYQSSYQDDGYAAGSPVNGRAPGYDETYQDSSSDYYEDYGQQYNPSAESRNREPDIPDFGQEGPSEREEKGRGRKNTQNRVPSPKKFKRSEERSGSKKNTTRRVRQSAQGKENNTARTSKTKSGKKRGSANRSQRQGGKSGGSGFVLPWYIHIILLGVIVLIAVIAIVRFNIWNRGETVEIDPNAQTMYSVEVNDNIVFLSDSKLEGKTDDGVTTVLCLGDAPFSDDTTASGLAGQISALSGVTTINASFPGSQVTCLNPTYQTDTQENMDDVFNLFYVSYDISIGDFTNLETVSAFHTDNPQYAAAVEALKSTDFQSLDYIAIMYDAVDYENGMSMYNADNPDDLTCYVGSLTNALKLIQNKYPWISIVFLSPTYVEHDNGDGTYSDARTLNLGNGTLNQYWAYSYDVCGDLSVSFLDNYYGSINDSNFTEYLTDDHFHINAAGRTKIADHFVYKVIQGNYSEYNVNALMVNATGDSSASASSGS